MVVIVVVSVVLVSEEGDDNGVFEVD